MNRSIWCNFQIFFASISATVHPQALGFLKNNNHNLKKKVNVRQWKECLAF